MGKTVVRLNQSIGRPGSEGFVKRDSIQIAEDLGLDVKNAGPRTFDVLTSGEVKEAQSELKRISDLAADAGRVEENKAAGGNGESGSEKRPGK